MLVSSILAVLGASTLAAATSAEPAVTSFLSIPDTVPTTLISITQPASSFPGISNVFRILSDFSAVVTSRPAVTRTISLRPAKTNSYEACGGLRATPKPCPASFECINDPFVPGCGLACDQLGICVVPIMCGGIAAIKCPEGKFCVDDPRDDCHPLKGGADCAGLCI
ncbi:proteinase inhibitor Kazal [Colletotrichum higginsianum]|nr:proteinase inhibitor Kazal [Colletotrichum higginsianum]